MTFPLRKGPSGPRNDALLNGAIRRQKIIALATAIPLGANEETPLIPADPNGLELTDPKPELYYSARVDFDVTPFTDSANPVLFETRIEVSIDNGPWAIAGRSSFTYDNDSDISGPYHYGFTLKPTLGSALGVLVGTASLRVRAVGFADESSQVISLGSGTLMLSLTEYTDYLS
jgi:hypothetical protein